MSKWLDQYLQKTRSSKPYKADIVPTMSGMSVPDRGTFEKNESDKEAINMDSYLEFYRSQLTTNHSNPKLSKEDAAIQAMNATTYLFAKRRNLPLRSIEVNQFIYQLYKHIKGIRKKQEHDVR